KTLETEETFLEGGEPREIEVIKTPTYGPRGELNGLQIICWDVTERKRLERALRESEAFYEALVESLPQGILRKDTAGCFTYVNRGACELLGLPRDALVGKTDFDICPAELAEKYRRDDCEVMDSGRRYEVVEENETIGASIHYVQTVKTPAYDGEGNPIGIQAIFWDVTNRRELEEALRRSMQEVERLRAELQALRAP
ncbi:MAG: PAS domain-containing protein, partial [Planctomycetes bacterium]|nr:PAS domain-containing protein [Planctomycetota bacterium]